jgi:hypothetical protein
LSAAEPVWIVGRRGRQDLQRDRARETRVARAIHLSHPARAEDRIDLEAPEASPLG